MSTYEKITSAAIGILVVAMLIFSYREISERGREQVHGPTFQQSIGQTFKIGPFDTVLNQQASGPVAQNCPELQPVILSTLHDIDRRLEELSIYEPGTFEVNQQTLDLLCHQNASITLSSNAGSKLLLVKLAFERKVPPGGSAEDIGTDVRINATVVLPGTVPPANPTVYGEELIPDRMLGATSTQQ